MSGFKPLPPLNRLQELLEVVPVPSSDCGIVSGLVWVVDRKCGVKRGDVAGYIKRKGSKKIRKDWIVSIDGDKFYVSRIIYCLCCGSDPGDYEVDHKDRNTLNNNKDNLRLATDRVQDYNRGVPSSNTSGAVGVSWIRNKSMWLTQLYINYIVVHKSYHFCLKQGAVAYNRAVVKHNLHTFGKHLNDIKSLKCTCRCCSVKSALAG